MNISRVRTLVSSAVVLTAALGLAACETTKVRTQMAPGASLTQYHTYNYFDKLATDKRGYTTITTRYIEDSVDREMRSRGYTRVRTNADLLVNLNIDKRDKVESTPGPGYGVGFGGWRRGFGYGFGWGNGSEIQTITEGTLTLDLVDRGKNELVWTGSATRALNSKIMDQPQPAIDEAVRKIFAKYPIAGGAPAGTTM